jgi:RNA polymerase sigma-70 factor (ECF subfamily)
MDCMGNDDHATIRAVLAGDKEAYGALVMRHSHTLFRVAYRISGNEADAEDVVQEALLRGYQKLDSFEARSNFGTWIYRIAVRCALDKIGSRPARDDRQIGEPGDQDSETVQVADESPSPERLLLSGEIGAMRTIAMHSLTPIERAAFVLRHMEGQTTEEIAGALGIAPSAAKQTVFRAVHKLRQRLSTLKVKA